MVAVANVAGLPCGCSFGISEGVAVEQRFVDRAFDFVQWETSLEEYSKVM